jgi:hypothetical protein
VPGSGMRRSPGPSLYRRTSNGQRVRGKQTRAKRGSLPLIALAPKGKQIDAVASLRQPTPAEEHYAKVRHDRAGMSLRRSGRTSIFSPQSRFLRPVPKSAIPPWPPLPP